MRRLIGPSLAAGLLGFASLSSAPAAFAARPGEDAPQARAWQQDTRRPLAVTFNPLGIVIQRYGGNVEYSFVPHNAVTLTGYVQSVPVSMVRPFVGDIEIRDRATSPGLGGELGYRLYTGRRGPEGLFLGASFVVMPLAYPRLGRDLAVELERTYAVGGAADIGAQTITEFGLTLGGGVGVSYVGYDLPNDPSRLPFAMPRVLPRLLVQTGFAF